MAQKAVLSAVFGVLGALLLLALTVYPFRFGPTESLALVVFLVGVSIFEFVLDDAIAG